DLTVDGEIDEVFELLLPQAPADEPELERRLLAALGGVLLVEGEAQLSVFEDEVLSRVVVSAARSLHIGGRESLGARVVGMIRRLPAFQAAMNGILHRAPRGTPYTLHGDGTP